MCRLASLHALIALALCGALLVRPAPAAANGVPVKVTLGYLDKVSNWGPTGAAGVAVVAIGDGRVEVTAAGLPSLDGQLYEAWLINTRTGDTFSAGRFNAAADGTVQYERAFDSIPDKGYDLFLLSIVDQDQQATGPTTKVSIAGYFPTLQPVDPSQRPAELPFTGGDEGPQVGLAQSPALTPAVAIGVVIGLLVGVALGLALGALRSARRSGRG